MRVRSSFMNALKGDDVAWFCEYRFQRSDGAWADVHNRASISRDRSGTALRVVGAVLDITENKCAGEELHRRTGDICVFAIEDNGIGIAQEDCGRVFRIFERLHGRIASPVPASARRW